MKIIYSDNIPSNTSSEHLWQDGFADDSITDTALQQVCDRLNRDLGDHQGPFYKIVPDDHELYKWEP
jgi:hypothetical protein